MNGDAAPEVARPEDPGRAARDLSGLRQLVRRRGPSATNAVALTFDDGPVGRTGEAVDVLDAHGAKATFFFVGEKVRGREPLLDRVLESGHEVGNHSFHHLYYPSAVDIRSTSALIGALTGVAPRLYRPPFGAIDRPTALAVRSTGMTPVTWDVDSEDVFPMWEGLPPEQVHRNVVERVGPGSIVLLHDGSVWSKAVEALPAILASLRERGLRLVTVSELLAEGASDGDPAGEPLRVDAPGEEGDRTVGPEDRPRARRSWPRLRRGPRNAPSVRSNEARGGVRRRTRHGARGEEAVPWPERLGELPPRRVVALLEETAPGAEASAPLRSALSARVAVNPAAFSRLGDRLGRLSPSLVSAVISGLAEAVRRARPVDWDGALTLVEATATARGGESTGSGAAERLAACGEAASLLGEALAARSIPRELAERAWQSVARLSWVGLDAPAGSEDGTAGEKVRVQAMRAVVRYAEWYAGGDKAVGGLREMPAVASNLEAHLDTHREPSEGVRGVYGSELARLHSLDRDWLAAHLDAILPSDPARSNYYLAARAGHLLWGTPCAELLDVFADHYRRAVDELPTPSELRRRDHGDPGRVLARHLGELLCVGALDLSEGGLVRRFVERAAPDELAYLVKFLGLTLTRDEVVVDSGVRERLAALWEIVRAEAERRPPSDREEVLAQFGSWYAAGELEPGWAHAQLHELLSGGTLPEPVFRVLERLADPAPDGVLDAARLEAAALLVGIAGERDLQAGREPLGALADRGLEASDERARTTARAVRDRFEGIGAPAPGAAHRVVAGQ